MPLESCSVKYKFKYSVFSIINSSCVNRQIETLGLFFRNENGGDDAGYKILVGCLTAANNLDSVGVMILNRIIQRFVRVILLCLVPLYRPVLIRTAKQMPIDKRETQRTHEK